MDFSFNEIQLDVQKLANQILQGQATTERLNKIDEQALRFDKALWAQLGESGLLGTAFAEDFGGMGLGFMELCLFIEEVGRTVAAVPVVPTIVAAGLPIQAFGTQEQKARLLPGLASGEKLVTAALHEAQNECPSTPSTLAVENDGAYKLSGTKICAPFAAESERVLVTAKVGSEVGVFLLNPNAPGVSLNAQISTTREPWYELVLDNAVVDAADVVMSTGGAEAARWLSELTAAAYCAMQVGVCDSMLKTTAQFTCEREQFGVPIGSFQAVQHRAADCFIDVQCLKLTTYQAASILDAGNDASNEVLIAKVWAGDTGHRVSYAAQHLHGGTGIDKDYHLWRFCLWARQLETVLGSSAQLTAILGKRIAAGEAFAV